MARKLVLSGPAAEAVERLARSAGVSPAELVRRALRREDEAQRGEAESRAQEDAGSQPGSDPLLTVTQTQQEVAGGVTTVLGTFHGLPDSAAARKITFSGFSLAPAEGSPAESSVGTYIPLPESSEPPTGTSEARRVRVHELPQVADFTFHDPDGGVLIGELKRPIAERPPGEAIEVPVPVGDIRITVEPSEDGRSIKLSWVRPADPRGGTGGAGVITSLPKPEQHG